MPSASKSWRSPSSRQRRRRRRRPWRRTGSWRPTTTARACSAVDQHVARRTRCGDQAATSRVNGDHEHVVDAGLREQRGAGVSTSVRVGGACSGRSTAIGCGSKVTATTRSTPSSAGDLTGPATTVLVAEVHAVEVADRDHGAAEVGGHLVERAPDLHGGATRLARARMSHRVRRPPRGRPMVAAPLVEREEPAVGCEHRDRAVARPSVRSSLRPTPHVDGLLLRQVVRREAARARPPRSAPGRTTSASASRVCAAVEGERSDRGAAQRRQVAADPECGAEVAGDRADVGAAAAPHRHVDVERRRCRGGRR